MDLIRTLIGIGFLWAALAATAAPDEVALGRDRGYPTGTPQTATHEGTKIGNFSRMDSVLPSRVVARAGAVWTLPAGGPMPPFTYTLGGARYTLDDYLARQRVTSLLVLHEGRVLVERYQYDRKPTDRFFAFSMSKSITSLLVGQALDRGLIRSLDDTAETYAPELAGSGCGKTRIRDLLHMSSGLRWEESYSGRDDVADLWNALFRVGAGGDPTAVLTRRRPRDAPAGARFKYATGETQVLCHVLQGAARRNVADLAQEWLWSRLGAESDASWAYGWQGIEYCGGGFSATTRDYARLGLLLAQGGQRGGSSVVPAAYLADATDIARQPPGFRVREATAGAGYGYQFWLNDALGGQFAMVGVYGQVLLVAPSLKLVVVHTAAWPSATDVAARAERIAMLQALTQAFAVPAR